MAEEPHDTREAHLDATVGSDAIRIGRFILLEKLGEGGMGAVFAAYDPVLGRRVAVKVLSIGAEDPRQRARLLREARAMARLSDPHVVAIYETGVHQGMVFMALELVQGITLKAWLATPRRWREVLRVFREAGLGLMAAHAAGLVHRDVKPANVLIEDPEAGGRVLVVDFGLAREERGHCVVRSPASSGRFGDLEITRTGAAAGTPAYMAPEQFLGEPIDARTDQFAFCVALWEALHGERPFRGSTRYELADAIVSGRRRAAVSRRVPARVQAALERGLSPNPDDRHPSMHALLDALDVDRARRWRGAAFAVCTLGLVGLVFANRASAPARCEGAEVHLASVWDEQRREQLRASFDAVQVNRAGQTTEQVVEALDRYALRWSEGHRDACEAATIRAVQSTETLDLRTRCLMRRLQSFEALLELLARPEAVVIEHALEGVGDLPAPESCGDLEFVNARVEPPADPLVAAQVEALRETLAGVEARRRTGLVDAALRDAELAFRAANEIDYPPVRAEAGYEYGATLDFAGMPTEAAAVLEAAYFEAITAGVDDAAAACAGLLTYVVGYVLGRDAEGMQWASHARAVVTRPGVDPSRRVRLALDVSAVHLMFERHEEAERELLEAIGQLRERDDEGLLMSTALNALGSVALTRGRLDEAGASLERALEIGERVLGDHHPHVAIVHQNLGALAWHRADYDRATVHQRRALEIRQSVLHRDHPDVVASLVHLAGTAVATEQLERARALLEQAVAVLERRGDQVVMHANALHNLAVVQRGLELPEAEDTARRALRLQQDLLGLEHLETARAHANLGWILLEDVESAEAEVHFMRALEIREEAQAPLEEVASARLGLAGAQWAAGRRMEAETTARRALEEAERAAEAGETLVVSIHSWLQTRAL